MQLTEKSSIKALRGAIYQKYSLQNLSSSYRSKKLRKVCNHANGLDLRKKSDVVFICQQIGILPHQMLSTPFVTEGQKKVVEREMNRISRIDFSRFFIGRKSAPTVF